MNAKENILQSFHKLTPKLQEAARYIVDHPSEVVVASMRTLAQRVQGQPATFVRLAQQLGYDGWPELRAAFARDLGLNSGAYAEKARSLVKQSSRSTMVQEMFAVLSENLCETERNAQSKLTQIAQSLEKARAVHIAGFRASMPVAYSLYYGYRLFRSSVFLLDNQYGALDMQGRAIEKDDVLVVISFSPYSRETCALMSFAQASGVHTIALTDSDVSPLALGAHQSVIFSVNSPSFFPSVTAGVALVEALLELLVAMGGDETVEKIHRTERSLFDSGSYQAR